MRILYSGALKPGSLTLSRLSALRELGHDVEVVDQVPFVYRGPALLRRVQTHLSVGPGVSAYNRALVARAGEGWDLIYVDQACFLTPATVRRLRASGAPVVQYTSDYFGFHRHSFRRLLRSVALYDAHVITNDFNRPELLRRGARTIVTTRFGYDPSLHRPTELSDTDRKAFGADVSFTGHWEPTTEAGIVALRRAGLHVRVSGHGWHRSALTDRREIRPITDETYFKVLTASKICVCFLSKWNRNLTAGRTFEIPAVGSFLLAERTPEHLAAFAEGTEAEYFGSTDELTAKALRYVEADDLRERIAAAGHRRCVTAGYRHSDRMGQVLDDLAAAGVLGSQRRSDHVHSRPALHPAVR
jgi:spore maturation protein CgeB